MAPFIESVLDQVKGDLAEVLSVGKIEQICRELNYTWRTCTLDPATTVHAFLRQVLAGNTACDHVPHLTGLPVTGEAYCKARSRLPVELFQRLMREVAEGAMQGGEAAARWCGHRLWNMDGSGCSMPDTPELQQAFGQSGMQKPGCGFPVAGCAGKKADEPRGGPVRGHRLQPGALGDAPSRETSERGSQPNQLHRCPALAVPRAARCAVSRARTFCPTARTASSHASANDDRKSTT